MIEPLIVLAVLVVLVLCWQIHDPAPARPRDRAALEGDPFCQGADNVCAWCVWRDGDLCTREGSPVSGREFGPVCIGRLTCDVRTVGR